VVTWWSPGRESRASRCGLALEGQGQGAGGAGDRVAQCTHNADLLSHGSSYFTDWLSART